MKKYAVIFDMDGVIAHTTPYHTKAFEAFFADYRIPYSPSDYDKHINGKHNSTILSHFFNRPINGQELLQLENEKESKFREIYKPHIQAITGLEDFIADLHHNGFKIAIGTAAPQANMDLIIDKLQIRHYMSSIICSELVENHKPHPEVYLKSAQNLKVPPSKCLVFEDSNSGISAAKNAGMKVIAVLSTHSQSELPPCDLYINDFREMNSNLIKLLLDH